MGCLVIGMISRGSTPVSEGCRTWRLEIKRESQPDFSGSHCRWESEDEVKTADGTIGPFQAQRGETSCSSASDFSKGCQQTKLCQAEKGHHCCRTSKDPDSRTRTHRGLQPFLWSQGDSELLCTLGLHLGEKYKKEVEFWKTEHIYEEDCLNPVSSLW